MKEQRDIGRFAPETLIECKVGWRSWRLVQPWFLASSCGRHIVPPRTKHRALCDKQPGLFPSREGHYAPELECTCGYYCCKTKEQLYAMGYGAAAEAIGEVWLWGKVIEHEIGFRSEYCYPKSIELRRVPCFLGNNEAAAKAIAEEIGGAYGVPCSIDVTEHEAYCARVLEGAASVVSLNPAFAQNLSVGPDLGLDLGQNLVYSGPSFIGPNFYGGIYGKQNL